MSDIIIFIKSNHCNRLKSDPDLQTYKIKLNEKEFGSQKLRNIEETLNKNKESTNILLRDKEREIFSKLEEIYEIIVKQRNDTKLIIRDLSNKLEIRNE